jgi:hypothetical protein
VRTYAATCGPPASKLRRSMPASHTRRTRRRSSAADSTPPLLARCARAIAKGGVVAAEQIIRKRRRNCSSEVERRQRRSGDSGGGVVGICNPTRYRALYKYVAAVQFLGGPNSFYGPCREFGLRSGPFSARTCILTGKIRIRLVFRLLLELI